MGVLSNLSAIFPRWRTAAPGTPSSNGSAAITDRDEKPTVSTSEKIAATFGAGMSGQIQFLTYLDTATADTPEVRAAMRLMLKDPYVKAAWLSQVFAVASEEFQVNAYDDEDPPCQEQADFIRDGIERLPLGSAGLIISLLLPLGPDGVSIVEPVTEIETAGRWAGRWVPSAAKAKDIQHLYLLGDKFRNILSIRSLRNADAQVLDAHDFLITKYAPLFEEPFGWAAFRSSYQEWWMLDTVRKLRGLHHEKRSAGTLIGTYEDKASKPTLEDTLKKLKNSTWGVIPKGVLIEALELSKASDTDYAKFEQDKIVGVVTGIAFAELQMLSGDVPDGRGDSQVHQASSDLAKWYLSRLATETINRQFIPRYIDWNFSGVKGHPRFSLGGINAGDVLKEIEQVKAAQSIGFDGQEGRPALSIKHYSRALSLQLADPRDPADRLMLAAPAPTGFGGLSAPGQPPAIPNLGPQLDAFAERMEQRFKAFAEEIAKKRVAAREAARFAERTDFALPGSDGAKAVDLLGSVQSAGVETLANLCRRAVTRLLADPNAAAATTLFDDAELGDLRDSISSALAAGDLLGRARVRRLADIATDRQDFAEPPNPFDVFADPLPSLLPRAALSFFQRLIPSLSLDPERYGPLMERHAFTMAHAADQVILGKVKTAILALLAGTPQEIPGTAAVVGTRQPERGPEAVERLLREAGVTPSNPQYAEMVYRTNTMDSYQAGVHAELATPEMQEMFPVWEYLGIKDGRQGEDHEPKFGKYYPSSAGFAEVRGARPFNCRCSSRPVTKFEWKRLQSRGAAVETSW